MPLWQVFPHLSETARKFKDKGLKVIGVTSEPKQQVLGFVKQMEGVMQYTVACDSRQECQAKLAAPAGVRGIPHAFVVGGDGVVKYSGHPMDPGFIKAVNSAVTDANPVRMEPLPPITASREELMEMKVKDLKGILTARAIPLTGLFEKGDIVSKILELCSGDVTYYAQTPSTRGGSSFSPPTPSAPAAPPPAPAAPEKPPNVVCEDGVCRVVPPSSGNGAGKEGTAAEQPPPEAAETPAEAPADSAAPPQDSSAMEVDDGLTSDSDLTSLKVSELKAALKARGISLAGLAEKSDLRGALQSALST